MNPPFVDLRVVTSGFECSRLGYDVLLENPCDPLERQTNYPRVWMALTALGLDQSDTIFLGVTFALIFYVLTFTIMGSLNYGEALVYSLILCSPSVMLLVERGNIDIIIFSLLSIALIIARNHNKIISRFFFYGMILFTAFLKLFPIFGLTVILRENKRKFIPLIAGLIAIFLIYILTHVEELISVARVTPSPGYLSYGYKVIFLRLRDEKLFMTESMATFVATPKIINLTFIKDFVNHIVGIITVLAGFTVGYKLLLKVLQAFRSWLSNNLDLNSEYNLSVRSNYIDAFRLGSSIYIGTFMLGSNWAYRLTFLIFTIPQILDWIKEKNKLSLASCFALVGIVATLYLSMKSTLNLDLVLNWFLLGYFVYSFTVSFPEWLRFSIHNNLSRR